MLAKQTILRSAALVSLVAGIGVFAAQSSLFPGSGRAQTAALTLAAATSPDTTPVAPALPIIAESAGVRLPGQSTRPPHATSQAVSDLGLPCGLSVSAFAMPGAVAALDIMDPCQPNMRVAIAHAGVTVTVETDALGLLTLDFPGLESPASFTVTLPDGQVETALASLPDFGDYDRVAVAWDNNRALELHAMDEGAEFGGPGHVWAGRPGGVVDAISGQAGFLVALGSDTVPDPQFIQIYTFPRASLRSGGAIQLSVDAPITEATCGKPVAARSVQITAGGAPVVTPIRFLLPGCEAVGDYLVLQNLFQDLRLAAN